VRRIADWIEPKIIETFPGYCWGKVVCWNVDNRRGLPEATLLLRETEARVRADDSLADVVAHPRIQSWREAFTRFGARPSKYQSSIEALVRRVRRGDELPPISPLVAVYNVVSLRFLMPIGGDDLDLISGDTCLTIASGSEPYTPLGTEDSEPPEPGEIIYADTAKVLCRRWSWRGGEASKISAGTTRAILNIHGLPPATLEDVTRASQTLADLVKRVCGGETSWYVLDSAFPSRVHELPV
jgi:lysyl-tRNA synthetase class 2